MSRKKILLSIVVVSILLIGCTSKNIKKEEVSALIEKHHQHSASVVEPQKLVASDNVSVKENLVKKEDNYEEVISQTGLHWHTKLSIYIDGKKQEIPGDIGLGFVHQSVHSHEADGTIHLEFEGQVKKSDTTLGVFFSNWGKKFNSECVFDFCNDGRKKVKMLVNGKENIDFEKYLMHDDDVIEIRYE